MNRSSLIFAPWSLLAIACGFGAFSGTAFGDGCILKGLRGSVYKALINRQDLADQTEPGQKAWRMAQKNQWRHADTSPPGAPAERRIKMKTNLQRRAGQSGGIDESADPAAPFTLKENDPRPAGMPTGVYWLNSGKYGYYSPTINAGLRGGARAAQRFEIEYQYRRPDGKVLAQRGGYADADSSWGWDGRMELQPNSRGGYDLIMTQGAMELPTNYRGALPGAAELPEVAKNNNTRSRHVFHLKEYVPASGGKPAKLVVEDQGSILQMKPSTENRWLEANPDGTLAHAHGYGENYVPDPEDPRKMWVDPQGYTWRIFDMVTAETEIRKNDGRVDVIPSVTRSVAYRMDPRNPSRIVPPGTRLPDGKPADAPVFITSADAPGRPAGGAARPPAGATIRYLFDTHGTAVKKTELQLDGKVKVTRDDVPQNEPATLVEGFNPVPGKVSIGGKQYYLGTSSAGEYTSGGVPEAGKDYQHYGAYLWFREAENGPIGPYTPVHTSDGKNFEDTLGSLTKKYGLSWGLGRPQAYQDELGRWWLDVHGVDVDLLSPQNPQSGYPPTSQMFRDDYRRIKMSIPIRWTLRDGQPFLEVDDADVQKQLWPFVKPIDP